MVRKMTLIACLALLALVSCGSGRVKQYRAEIVAEYPHDTLAYTQGLFFDGGRLIETTGQFEMSTLREVDLATGAVKKEVYLGDEIFGEGSVVFDGKLYVLSWLNRIIFEFDPVTFERLEHRDYPREGWGITTDGKRLYASDGSSHIYLMDKNLHLEKKLTVRLDGKPVRWLNELEWINGKIWANVYTTDTIVIIDPKDGKVTGTIDCSGIYPKKMRRPDDDVLNGIAINPADGKIYLTGKNWPKMYEIKLSGK